MTLPNALKSSSCAIIILFCSLPQPLRTNGLWPKGRKEGEIEMLVYLMFSSSKCYLTLSAEFTLPCRFLPIIVARSSEWFTHHILDKFIDKVVAFFCILLQSLNGCRLFQADRRTAIQRFVQEWVVCWIGEIRIEYVGSIPLAQSWAVERNAHFIINESNAIDASAFVLSDYHTQALFLQPLSQFFLRPGRTSSPHRAKPKFRSSPSSHVT